MAAIRDKQEIIIYPIFLFLLAMFVSSCAEKLEPKDLYGTYIAKYLFGTDKIVLKEDGTYFQEVIIDGDPKSYTTTGTWKQDNYRSAVTNVIFQNAFAVSDGIGNLNKDFDSLPRGVSVLPVERYFFSRKLRLGPDEGNPHVKV